MSEFLRIGDLIEAPPVQTVIRLEEGRTQSESISQSFVFTSDVTSHFAVLVDSLLKDHGRGFFLQGDFGSGKSHFLAVLTAWLTEGHGSKALSDHHGGLRRVEASGRRFLAVDVSLVKYRSATSLEQIFVEATEAALASRGFEVRLTPFSAFLSHFASLLENRELGVSFAKDVGIPPDETGVYLREHPRESYAAGVRCMKNLGMEAPETLVEERHETFARVITAVKSAGFDGLVFIIDELSEFFRSKPDARALNEDARTLQFLGELTESEPVWIIAAVQESIERTGDISQVTFRKIKDRFPVKFSLSTLHIKALISGRLVKKKPGADKELHNIYGYINRQFPSFTWSFEEFRATYPVHPATIALLDGLGELFSVHRGIVDFVHSRIAGDESRLIPGILDRPCHELLGPDSIYDHFSRRMAEFSSFYVYPNHVIPHLDEVIERVIDEPEDRALAHRIVRVLVLYKIHPTANTPTVKDLTELVACAISEQNPDMNVQFVAEAILDLLVEESKFIVKRPSDTEDPLDVVYAVVTEEDPTKTLKAKISRVASEIPFDDTRLLTEPFSGLPESASWPGPGFVQRGITRFITWRQSNRQAFVCFVNPALLNREEETLLKDRIAGVLSGGDTDFAVVISLGETGFQLEHAAVWGIPISFGEEEVSILREFLATKQIALGLRPSNPADVPLIQAAEEAVLRLSPAANQIALNAFYSGDFTNRGITVEPVIRQLKRFDRLLDVAGQRLLEERYPGYKEIEPRKTSPSPRLYQRLLDEFVSPGSLSLREAHSRGLNDAIEGLATPLGLVELRSGSYIFAPDPESHPLLSTLFGLINTAGETKLEDVLHSLRTGRFGIPSDTSFFLLSALAYGGLITLMKHNRAIPLELLRLTAVENADALAPGEVIGKHDRKTLISECAFLSPTGGWDSFGLRQQRETWQGVVKFRDWAQKTMSDLEKSLSSIAEFSAFESFDLDSLRSQLNALRVIFSEIKVSYPAREGLERFLRAWRGTGFTSQRIDFLKKMHAFLTRQADQFVFVNHYIRHTAVDRAAAGNKEIAGLQNEVARLFEQPDVLVMNDDVHLLTDAFDRFRVGYADFYAGRHGEYYKDFAKKPISRFAKRALVLLRRLASIEILDRPEGMEGLFRELEAPARVPCKRNLAEELIRSPVCGCGFIPGETPEPVQIKDPEEVIERCLNEYLLILKSSRVREAISARIFALADADPDTVKRLRSLNALLEDDRSSPSALFDLLDDVTVAEISKSLSGRVPIERRELGDLVSRLGGRRLAPDQITRIIREWISVSDDNSVIAIESNDEALTGSRASSFSWWPMMHPGLFKDDARHGVRDIEASLERCFPSSGLRDILSRLDDDDLAGFLADEPFHTGALRMAWLLFSERILSGISWPDVAEIASSHIDREIAMGIRERLDILKRITTLSNAPLPDALRIRIPLSEIIVDPWATTELRSLARRGIDRAAQRGEEWLSTIPPVEPISLLDNPVVVILDAVSPDVWLDTMDSLRCEADGMELSWFRLEVSPKTALAVSALFGFSGDAMDEFGSRGISYHQIKGDEQHGMADLLPAFSPEKAVVIRVSLVDEGAHAAYLRLAEMSGAVCAFLENELLGLREICATQKRRLVLTTDHGLSLTKIGLSHGKGGVFERGLFRAEWGM